MSDYRFPEVPELEGAYRTAHRALEGIIPRREHCYAPEEDLPAFEVFSQFSFMVREAAMALAAHLGPRISWEDERCEGDWDLIISGVDLDAGEHDLGVILGDSACESDGDGNWEGSALDIAGRVYRRACKWDFSPGKAGIWLLTLAPTSASGGEGQWFYSGHLAGFVILYDRDKDGLYESVGHIWTAQSWRRRGIATRLLQEARSRFGASTVEGPFTDDGAALVKASWLASLPAGQPQGSG